MGTAITVKNFPPEAPVATSPFHKPSHPLYCVFLAFMLMHRPNQFMKLYGYEPWLETFHKDNGGVVDPLTDFVLDTWGVGVLGWGLINLAVAVGRMPSQPFARISFLVNLLIIVMNYNQHWVSASVEGVDAAASSVKTQLPVIFFAACNWHFG